MLVLLGIYEALYVIKHGIGAQLYLICFKLRMRPILCFKSKAKGTFWLRGSLKVQNGLVCELTVEAIRLTSMVTDHSKYMYEV